MNFLTVDVEDWYHANLLNIPKSKWGSCQKHVVKNTGKLLDLFREHNVRATFFILGYVAETEPELVREIVSEGHEVASHGYDHQLVNQLTDEAFREDVRRSKAMIETVSEKKVSFYRAPSWSISIDQVDKLRILAEEGYEGDSSLQPFWTPLSGSLRVPVEPFYPKVDGDVLPLLEVPPTVLTLAGLRLPFLGGFYLRAMPLPFIHMAMKRLNQKRNGLLYVHPWEVDVMSKKDIGASGMAAFVHLYRLSATYPKLDALLSNFEFQEIGKSLLNSHYPVKEL